MKSFYVEDKEKRIEDCPINRLHDADASVSIKLPVKGLFRKKSVVVLKYTTGNSLCFVDFGSEL